MHPPQVIGGSSQWKKRPERRRATEPPETKLSPKRIWPVMMEDDETITVQASPHETNGLP